MKSYSTEAVAALASGDVIVSGAVRFGLPEPIGFWGGHGYLSLADQVFIGVGDNGLVSVSSGTLGGAEQPTTIELSGVDSDVAGRLDLAQLRGVGVVLWRLIFDGSGANLLHAAVFLRGRVDSAPIKETPGGGSTITIGIEGAARGLGRRSERMRTDADQRLIDPNDGSLRRVSYAGEKQIVWGGKPPQRAGAALGGVTRPGWGGILDYVNQSQV